MADKEHTKSSFRERRSPFHSRRFTSFLVCVLLSGLFWLLHALSKEYVITIRVPVAYTNLPEQQFVAVDLPDSVDALVQGSGFTLFACKWANVIGPLDLDARQARALGDGEFALATYSHSDRLEGAVGHGLKVLRVMPDTIVLSFQGRVEKQVPVRPRAEVKCAPLFRLGDSITTVPAFVTVSGAEALVNRITFVETEPKSYIDLNASVNEAVSVVLPDEFSQLNVQPEQVNLVIPVGRYTEGRFTIPVEPVNVPPNVILKTFPDKVDVVFQVPIEDFSAVNAGMFRVVADYSKADPSGKTMSVEVVRQPLNIRNLRIVPSRVEFLIRK